MAEILLVPSDLDPFLDQPIAEAKAVAMIADAVAMAALVAPCITEDGFAYVTAARAILRGAVLRWIEAGSGAFQSTTTGPFGATVDTRQARRGMFFPSEIEQLQGLCAQSAKTGKAFNVDTVPATGLWHAALCALNFGALYCSCGADLTLAGPLYEVDP